MKQASSTHMKKYLTLNYFSEKSEQLSVNYMKHCVLTEDFSFLVKANNLEGEPLFSSEGYL